MTCTLWFDIKYLGMLLVASYGVWCNRISIIWTKPDSVRKFLYCICSKYVVVIPIWYNLLPLQLRLKGVSKVCRCQSSPWSWINTSQVSTAIRPAKFSFYCMWSSGTKRSEMIGIFCLISLRWNKLFINIYVSGKFSHFIQLTKEKSSVSCIAVICFYVVVETIC